MKNGNNLLWSLSLLAISAVTIILMGANIIGIALSDTIVRMCGLVNIVAIPVLVYATAVKMKQK